jgi:hypothetical protein
MIKKPSHATVPLKRAYSHAVVRIKIWEVNMVPGTVKKNRRRPYRMTETKG